MSETGKIHAAIMVAMTEIGVIGKNKKNPQQNYNFRGIDDVLNSLQPALIKAKVFIVPRILSMAREERASKSGGVLIYSTVHGEYDFVSAEDGSKITASTYGEGMDSSDKSTNKAMSAALKYAVIQTLAIPTMELVDSETEHPEPKKKETPPPPPKPPKAEAPADAATAAQRGKLFALCTEQGWDRAKAKAFADFLLEMGGFEHFTRKYISECIDDFAARAADFELAIGAVSDGK